MSLPSASASLTPSLDIRASATLGDWLREQSISFAFTTYQTNRLFCVGTTPEVRLAVHERLFDKPMGLYAHADRLYLSTRYQIWQFDNLLAPGELRQGCDRLYVPKTAHTTGDLSVHDVVIDHSGALLFVNTDFSCLATLSPDYSFVPLWQPPFIRKLVAEDRCHLNGVAMRSGQPAYVTACSTTDTAAGWRDHRVRGGAVIDVSSKEIITTGLSMPHSPRWYQDKLWLLNSGTGELGQIDLKTGQFIPLTFCPGFVQGLAFWQNFALVGLSKLRAKPFSGLALEERLTAAGQSVQCGLLVIDLNSGQVVHWLQLEGVVEELFDVVVLPGVRQPQTIGFQSEDIERLVTFPGSGGIVTTKPTVKRPSIGGMVPIAGVPRQVWDGTANGAGEDIQSIVEAGTPPSPPPLSPSAHPPKFQQVFHLNAESLAPYDPFTYPSLQQRWKTQPQRGELLGTSASVDGEMVAFAIAELLPDRTAEMISLFVAQPYRQKGIATRLVAYLERSLQAEGCTQVEVQYEPTLLTALALEALLLKLGWQEPQTTQTGGRRSLKCFMPTPIGDDRSHTTLLPHSPSHPRVSLVMTVYNTEAYLAQALDSLLAQTFSAWELILWDDGSTDRSRAIAQDYAQKDARIRWQQGDRLGRGEALVQAHVLTRGEYVGWLDADDLLASTALQETVGFLDSHPDYGMVYTNHIDIDAQGQTLGLGRRCQTPYTPLGLLVNLMTFHFRLLRQSVFATIGGFNPEFAPAEDYDLCLRVSEVTQIHHLERSLYFYRRNPQGLSHQQSQLQRQYSEQAINQALQRRGLAESLRLTVDETTGEFRLQRQQPAASLPSDAARSQFEQGKALARQGDLAAAVACFQEALQLQPDYLAAYNQLGNALQGLGQLEAAIVAYQTLLTLNPNVAQAHCNLGAIWQIQGKPQDAIAAYRQALVLKPDLAAAQHNLATLLTYLEER